MASSKRRPKRKAAPKATPSTKPNPDRPATPKPKPQPKNNRRDPELEEIELKRKSVVMKNKWISSIESLNEEISVILEQAKPFDQTKEFLGKFDQRCSNYIVPIL